MLGPGLGGLLPQPCEECLDLDRDGTGLAGQLARERRQLTVDRGHVVGERRGPGQLLCGARLDLDQRLGRVTERALDDAVRVEQPVAPGAQLVDLSLEQHASSTEVGEDPLAHRARLVDEITTRCLRSVDLGTGGRDGLLARGGDLGGDRGAQLGDLGLGGRTLVRRESE